jgi:hypothetical protein
MGELSIHAETLGDHNAVYIGNCSVGKDYSLFYLVGAGYDEYATLPNGQRISGCRSNAGLPAGCSEALAVIVNAHSEL